MDRQKIGINLFWLGVFSIFAWQAWHWTRVPMQRVHTAQELIGTLYSPEGTLFLLETYLMVPFALILPFLGVLLYSGEKGS